MATYLTKDQRVELTVKFVNLLTDKPQSLQSLAEQLGKTRDNLWHLFKKLKEAKVIQVSMGIYGGITRKADVDYSEAAIREVLGYAKIKEIDNKCRICKERKPKLSVERNFYVDDKNRRWAGRKCPDCAAVEHKKLEPVKITHRKCRDCGCNLPITRYFKCHNCQPELPNMDDDFIYYAEDSGFSDRDIEIVTAFDVEWGYVRGTNEDN